MPETHLHASRTYMTAAIAAGHATIVILGIIGRLNHTAPTQWELLTQVMDNNMWVWLHAAAAMLVIISLRTHRREFTALSMSVGVWAAWSFLSLLWGLSTDPPISLVAPAMAGGVTILAYLLTLSWVTPHDDRGK